jgi:transcriptional regulator GlxA family with amidase domain
MRGLADARIARALALMHERFAEPWTLETLARAVGMSRTALALRFKALVGEAPIGYLTHWRITRAANLLRTERTSLDRVAEAVGYNLQPVFSKAFRRVTGHTPARWRRGEGIAAGINIAP